jgi:hypothetical protein
LNKFVLKFQFEKMKSFEFKRFENGFEKKKKKKENSPTQPAAAQLRIRPTRPTPPPPSLSSLSLSPTGGAHLSGSSSSSGPPRPSFLPEPAAGRPHPGAASPASPRPFSSPPRTH